MSKIVILSAQLGAPQIIDGLLEKIAAQNPSLADWIKQLDTVPIIRECVGNALNRLYGMSGIQKDTKITDFYDNAYSGKLDGVVRTDRCPKGLGLRITPQGAIEFVADDYRSEWRNEIERLRGLFTDAFLAEVTSSILQILGYEVTVQVSPTGQGGVSYNLEGVKQ